MKPVAQKWWTLVAVIGLAYWLFGNLYEAVVLSPNWVTDSPAQMTRLNLFFVNTSPTLYFVPLTILATILVWMLQILNKDDEIRSLYRRASLFAVLLTAVNLFIVSTVVTKLFGTQYLTDPGKLTFLAWEWNVLNIVRMALTATTAGIMFQAFRRLDQRSASQH
jgi:hypothetical protein